MKRSWFVKYNEQNTVYFSMSIKFNHFFFSLFHKFMQKVKGVAEARESCLCTGYLNFICLKITRVHLHILTADLSPELGFLKE